MARLWGLGYWTTHLLKSSLLESKRQQDVEIIIKYMKERLAVRPVREVYIFQEIRFASRACIFMYSFKTW